MISVALHPRQHMNPQVYSLVDRVNFMAYDLDAHHVAEYESVVKAVDDFLEPQYDCPSEKVLLGLPAYGRHFRHPALVKTFAELMDESSDTAISRHVWNGYRYDTPSTVQQKVDLAVSNGMAGVFFWELGQDKQHAELGPGGILLEAASNSAKQALAAKDEGEDEAANNSRLVEDDPGNSEL